MSDCAEIGLFAQRLTLTEFKERPALFLDRDGVVVEETNYLHRVQDVAFIPGVAEAIARANQRNIAVVMVTNQAGIGRGYYGWREFEAVQESIYVHCGVHGAHFDMALACAFHAEGKGAYAVADHPWRKPNPGMLLEAARALGVDLAKSFIVGDSLTDLAAASAAGLCGGALVGTGHGAQEWERRGARQFAAWHAEGRFQPVRADVAGNAISDWLRSL